MSTNRVRHLAVVISVLAFLFPVHLWGQIGFTTSSSDLVVCGAADTFAVTLTNQGAAPLTNISILLELNEGVEYLSGSVSGPGIAEQSIPTPDSVLLSSDTIQGFQSVSFIFRAFASCAASDSAAIFNQITVTHNNGVDSVDSAPYSILKAALSIQSITPASVTDTLGASFTQCVSIINGGFGSLSGFVFAIQVDTAQLGYSNFRLSPSNQAIPGVSYSGDSIILKLGPADFSITGDNDVLFEQNETIEICYDVEIKSCSDAPSIIHASWGCSQETCESTSQNANVIVEDIAPVLTTSRIFLRNTCYGEDSSVTKIIVTNTGSGPATNVLLDFWIGGVGGASNNYISSIDTGSIQWVSSSGAAQHVSPFYVENSSSSGNLACLGPNPIRRARVNIPFIAAGEQDTLIYKSSDCCKQWCEANPIIAHRSYYEFKYYGQCDSILFGGGPINITGYNFGRVLSFAPNGPTDINPGDTALYCIEHSNFRFYNFAPGAYAFADIILPPNLSYTGLPGDIFYEDPQGDVWNPNNVTVIGDTVRATFPLPVGGGVTLEKVNLKIRLVPNCPTVCSGGISTIEYNLYEVADTSCSCVHNISCYSWDVNVHCGLCNCADGGLIFRNFTSTRDNFGLPDNNDDGIPDGSGSIDSNLVRMNYVMFGDTLLTRFHGTIDTTLANPFWTGGYASSEISRGSALTPISVDMEIHDQSNSNVYNCTMALPTVANLGGNIRLFTFDFDTTLLSACLPPGFVFDEGDSLVLSARYRISTNTGGSVTFESITNEFAMVNPVSNDTGACDAYSGAFVLVGYYYTNCCYGKFNASGCNNITISQNHYLSIGNCCSNYSGGNLFEYEYRPWALIDGAQVFIPSGYNFVSASLEDRRTAGTQGIATATSNVTPYLISGDTLYFNFDSIYVQNGGSVLPSDDGFLGIFRITLQPSCAVDEGAERVWTTFDWAPVPQLTGPGAYPISRTSYDSLAWQGASISVTPTVQTIPGINGSVYWEFQIENSANIHTASNTWFALVSPSGQISPITVSDIGNSSTLTPVNGIYQVGDILADSIRTFGLLADYSNCSLDSIRVLVGWDCPAYPSSLAAANCVSDSKFLIVDPQPADMQATLSMASGPFDICDSIPVEINVISSQTASINDILINVLLPLTGGLDFAPGSAEFSYPSSGTFAPIADPTIAGTFLTFDIDSISALIEANDLPGSVQPDSNSFTLRFWLTTGCDFASGRRFLVRVTADEVCGDPIAPILLFSDPIDINGATTAYSTDIGASISQNTSCPDNQTLTINFANTGLGTTASGDSVYVDLNPGYGYAGNFVGMQNPPAVTNPSVQSLAGGTRLAWEVPAGLSVGDSMSFSFDLNVYSQVACGNDIATVSSEVSSSLFCARTATNCNASAVTGSFSLNIPISRPDLQLNSFASTIGPGPSGFQYTYSGTIDNNGAAIPGGTSTNVQFYCDSDMSGTINAGDVLIGTYNTTVGISNGSPHSFSGQFNFGNSVCTDTNQIFAMIVPDTATGYCLCDTAFANTNVVLPVAWMDIDGEAQEQGNYIAWTALLLNGHDHFVVERKNESAWEAISPEVRGISDSYDWLHNTPATLEHYRIRAMDQNGSLTYSESILIDRTELKSCRFYPNPARSLVYLDGPAGTMFKITSLMGQTIAEGVLEEGLTEVALHRVASGVYLIEFDLEEGIQVERMVVE